MAEEFTTSDEGLEPDAQDVVRCTFCEIEIATHFCRTCTDDLCPSCRNFHVKSKVIFGHEIVAILEKHKDAKKPEKCIIHENNIYIACCVKCKLPVCIECMKSKHNGHQIDDILRVCNEEKKKAETKLSELKKRILTDRIISSTREGMFQIEKWFEDKREEYKREGEVMKKKVEALVNENIEKTIEDEKKQKKIFEEIEEQNATALKDLITKYEEQLSRDHPAELLVFLEEHVPNPEKKDIYLRMKALSVQDVCTIKLEHQPESISCAESIIKMKKSPLNEIEWMKIMYLDAQGRQYQCNENILLVASIVIGTTHSHAALSFLHEYKENPLNISFARSIANTVLHNRESDIIYAGEDAEKEYADLEEREISNFSILKEMKITDSLLEHSILEAEGGSTMLFSTFYTKIIDFWRNNILSSLEKRKTTIVENEILWVFSLPPPWDSTSEKMLMDYLVQERIENYSILSSETAILGFCEFASSRVGMLNGKNAVQFSKGERVLFVQSEVEFADITSAVVLENCFVSPIKKKRDTTLSVTYLKQNYITEMSEILEMNRDDLGNLIEEDDLLKNLRHKCKLGESVLQTSKLRIILQEEEILDTSNLSRFVNVNGPILSVHINQLIATCTMLSSLLQDFSLRISHEIKKFTSESTAAYIIVVGEFAFWPIVLEKLQREFPETCILVPKDVQLSVIAAGSVIHGHKLRCRKLE